MKPFHPSPNSFKNTFCVFTEVDIATTAALKPNYKSESGSAYYYTEIGMYRLSNHWGRLANSKWRLVALEPETQNKFKLGFAKWEDFFPDNATEKLYYIVADFEKHTANYEHRNNPFFDNKAILRDTKETTKRLKQIRNILTLTNWAKYFDYQDIEALRFDLVNKLITTDLPLETIKNKWLSQQCDY